MEERKKPVFRLGITGGIGSGKTSVCRVFEVLKVPVFSADSEARAIMENDEDIIKKLNTITGENLYINGNLNREELARLIFNDNNLIEKVNSLVHPAVFDRFREWSLNQTAPYVIMEAAILFESGAAKFMDRVATVVAPVEQRIERVILRNKLTREQIMDRIRNQMDDDARIKLSDYTINNSENDMILPVILKIHSDILKIINTQS